MAAAAGVDKLSALHTHAGQLHMTAACRSNKLRIPALHAFDQSDCTVLVIQVLQPGQALSGAVHLQPLTDWWCVHHLLCIAARHRHVGCCRGHSLTRQVPPGFVPTRSPILHVALEYTLPHVASSQLMYGGMGLVVDTFLKVSPAWGSRNAWTAPYSDANVAGHSWMRLEN